LHYTGHDALEAARAHYEAALPIYREIQDRLGEANTLQSIGRLLRAEKQLENALEAY
jgi:exonuclease VII small subunit